MGRTFVNQERQIAQSDVYDDTITPSELNFETNPAHLETDLNNIRSMLSHLLDAQAGNWYDVISTPATFTGEGETQRGVSDLNDDLHELERKRVLVKAVSLADVTVPASQNWVVLGTGQFPPNTTAAVGAVTTQGTVAATHGGTFDSHDLTEVSGSTAISPKNFVEVVDGATRDPILSSGRTVYGLLHGESGLADGDTIVNTTPDRAQVSFVRINAAGDDLEAVPVSDIENAVVNFCFTERKALDDLTEQDFLRGAVVDVPASTTVTRQVGYDNQGTTPVDLTTSATLDLEGAGLTWAIRDDAEANLFSVVEGSAGGTSQINVHADVDEFDVDAAVNDFLQGVTMDSGGTAIDVGVTAAGAVTSVADLLVQSSGANDLRLLGAQEMFLDDGNQAGSTWAQTNGIKLSEDTGEWDSFETAFGEVSILNAIVQANNSSTTRSKTVAVATANVSADTDVSGPSGASNLDVDLGNYSAVTFVTDVDVFLNGVLLRNGADAAANHDVYPGTDTSIGELRFEFNIKGTGSKPDQITMIIYS